MDWCFLHIASLYDCHKGIGRCRKIKNDWSYVEHISFSSLDLLGKNMYIIKENRNKQRKITKKP
jgi:hypothetical protein